jgi:hypothetical protein
LDATTFTPSRPVIRSEDRTVAGSVRDVVFAGSVAAVFSGIPSTAHALATGREPLAAARAAGTILLGEHRPNLAAGVAVHVSISFGWAAVLARALPRRATAAWGAVAGLGIAALDLGLLGRRYPAIRRLPALAQVADHVAFGYLVGHVLQASRGR